MSKRNSRLVLLIVVMTAASPGCAHVDNPDFDVRRDSIGVGQVIEITQRPGRPHPNSAVLEKSGFKIYTKETSLASALGEASSGKFSRAMLRRLLARQPARKPFDAMELVLPGRRETDTEVLDHMYLHLIRSGRVWIFDEKSGAQIESVLFTKLAPESSGVILRRAYTHDDRTIIEAVYGIR